MSINKRTISIGKLRTASLAYLSGFFGEAVTREEMITLREAAEAAGAKYLNSNAWHSLRYFDLPVEATPRGRDIFARDTVDWVADRAISTIRWKYGRQCKLFMQGYFDGLPEHLSLFDAFEMMKDMAPSYFREDDD